MNSLEPLFCYRSNKITIFWRSFWAPGTYGWWIGRADGFCYAHTMRILCAFDIIDARSCSLLLTSNILKVWACVLLQVIQKNNILKVCNLCFATGQTKKTTFWRSWTSVLLQVKQNNNDLQVWNNRFDTSRTKQQQKKTKNAMRIKSTLNPNAKIKL